MTLLRESEDGTITSDFGDVGDLEPCVLISAWVVEATRGQTLPVCAFAAKMLGPGASARTDGDVLTIEARDGTLVYDLHPAAWEGEVFTASPMYLGVLR